MTFLLWEKGILCRVKLFPDALKFFQKKPHVLVVLHDENILPVVLDGLRGPVERASDEHPLVHDGKLVMHVARVLIVPDLDPCRKDKVISFHAGVPPPVWTVPGGLLALLYVSSVVGQESPPCFHRVVAAKLPGGMLRTTEGTSHTGPEHHTQAMGDWAGRGLGETTPPSLCQPVCPFGVTGCCQGCH